VILVVCRHHARFVHVHVELFICGFVFNFREYDQIPSFAIVIFANVNSVSFLFSAFKHHGHDECDDANQGCRDEVVRRVISLTKSYYLI